MRYNFSIDYENYIIISNVNIPIICQYFAVLKWKGKSKAICKSIKFLKDKIKF